jgi:hypothetical protein
MLFFFWSVKGENFLVDGLEDLSEEDWGLGLDFEEVDVLNW